jgi:DNA-binding response OmpR family regulator
MPKILVIEDTPDMQKLIESNLSARGHRVIPAVNGELGLSLARQEKPDLILLDIRLPGLTGWEVLTTLKADNNLKPIPVVVMTASEGLNDEKRAISMGAACYLSKPFALRDLLSQIKKLAVSDEKTE